MAENHQKKSQVIRFLPNCAHIGFDYQLIFAKSNIQSNLNFGAKIHIMRHFLPIFDHCMSLNSQVTQFILTKVFFS